MLLIDISLESDTWLSELPDVETLVHRVAQAAVSAVPDTPGNAELSVLLTGDANIRRLNRDYRASDAATNVLAFGNYDQAKDQAGPISDVRPVLIGDVVIAFEVVAMNFTDENPSFFIEIHGDRIDDMGLTGDDLDAKSLGDLKELHAIFR